MVMLFFPHVAAVVTVNIPVSGRHTDDGAKVDEFDFQLMPKNTDHLSTIPFSICVFGQHHHSCRHHPHTTSLID